ncbi:hypothetical protein L7F22_006214 [Adiantum nelumboides]|nr:hypothetical protein [Adiantum nelumboides]
METDSSSREHHFQQGSQRSSCVKALNGHVANNLNDNAVVCNHIEDRDAVVDESEEEEELGKDQHNEKSFVVSPILPLKDQLEKDKDDESLRRWKEQLLGGVMAIPIEGENLEPKVQVLNFTMVCDGRPEIVVHLPLPSNHKTTLFTIKEGCIYNLKLSFLVQHNIVSGLTYIRTVWKNGFKVEKTQTMLGTFGPQADPYTHILDEEIAPSGIFARGNYTTRIQFVDDDRRSHLDFQHIFSIVKEWQ